MDAQGITDLRNYILTQDPMFKKYSEKSLDVATSLVKTQSQVIGVLHCGTPLLLLRIYSGTQKVLSVNSDYRVILVTCALIF